MVTKYNPTLKMYDTPRGEFVHLSDYEAAIEKIARLEAERDELRALCGLGCDAAEGGPHTIIRQGRYSFCGACGHTIRLPTLHERARTAEAQLAKEKAENEGLREVLFAAHNMIENTAFEAGTPAELASAVNGMIVAALKSQPETDGRV